MRVEIVALCLTQACFASPEKEKAIVDLIQTGDAIRRIAAAAAESGELRPEAQKQLDAIVPNDTPSTQLFRIGMSAFSAAYPQDAADVSFDRAFDYAAWRCVALLAARPTADATDYLRMMKAAFGQDGGGSLRFEEYMKEQRKLRSEPAPPPNPRQSSGR